MDFAQDYWLLIAVTAAVILILAFLLLRPKQRVELSKDSAPVRPHMQQGKAATGERKGIAAEAAAAASDVTGQILGAPVHANLPGALGPPDDLTRLKGVGPKFAALLNDVGITRYDQLARLSGGDIERLDQQLGPFKGRLERDQVPLQAEYLASGDEDGFEQRFGKL
jgi:predicted flap endonuclease-1-like 5' DNA nuclease